MCFAVNILWISCVNAQKDETELFLTPNGYFDKVFDDKGTIYNLSDIQANRVAVLDNGTTTTTTLLCISGIFELYFETGSGMEIVGNFLNDQRRAIFCQAFQDMSDFINTPLKKSGNSTKVKIWVRNPTAVGLPAQAGGVASAYYNLPAGLLPTGSTNIPNKGAIVDNEIWKTIHTGVDSYNNTVFPIINNENPTGFYHGWMSINFNGTATWNLDYNKYNASTGFVYGNTDLYTTIIHEITHALGFSSLISYNGLSKINYNSLGNYFGNYYTRYDTFLTTFNNQKLIYNNPNYNGQLFDFSFDQIYQSSLHPGCILIPPLSTSSTPNQDQYYNCSTILKYTSNTVTSPIYTAPCFESGSSLSHFEDACYNGNSNNEYFMMSNMASGSYAKRYLKLEERLVLCDIGYSMKKEFGSSNNFTYKSYGTSDCSGITVAGVNDGYTTTGGYAFQGNSGTDISINGILNNDYTAGSITNLRYEFVRDLYDPDAIFSIITGNNTQSFTFKSYVPGIHLLSYVPYDIITGQRGNITYIYVNVFNNCTIIDSCNLVINGNFEEHFYPPLNGGEIFKACGWQNASQRTSSDYFNSDSASSGLSIPCNMMGNQLDKITGNHAYGGMFIMPNRSEFLEDTYSESIKTELASSLMPNTQYQLSFDVSLAGSRSLKSIKFQMFLTEQNLELTTGGIIPTNFITSNTVFLTNPTFSSVNSAEANGWETLTFTFFTPNNPNLKYLYLGGLNNVQFQTESVTSNLCNISSQLTEGISYYYLDNVSLIQYTSNITIDAIDDDFSSLPVNTNTGAIVASVYENDLYNNVPATSDSLSNINFSLVNPLTIPGATINNLGYIYIPAGTPVGTFTLTYKIEVAGGCGNFDTANVIIYVSNLNQTPNISSSIRANNIVNVIDIQSSNKILIAGNFTTYNNIVRNGIARLNTDLTLDTSFNSIGTGNSHNPVIDMVIQNDDKAIVVGSFNSFSGGSNGYGIARLLLNGSIDTSFNVGGVGTASNGISSNNRVHSCAIQPDGKILIGGDFYYYNGVLRVGIARLNSNGSIDTSFNPTQLNTYARSIAADIIVQPDGKILLVGFFLPSGMFGISKRIIRLNSNGSIDTTFNMGNTNGSTTLGSISSSLYFPISRLVLQSDGKIIAAGAFDKFNGNTVKSIVRLMPNGQIDTSFNTNTGVERAINTVVLESGTNKIIIGGEFTTFGSVPIKKLIRLDTFGNLDNTFNIGTGTFDSQTNPNNPYFYNNIRAIKKQLDGKIIVGGKFTSFNGITAGNITRIYGNAGLQAKSIVEEYTSEPEININFENKNYYLSKSK